MTVHTNQPSVPERLAAIETAQKYLVQSQSDLETQVTTGFSNLNAKFELYVRLERYRIVELAVFGTIALMTTSVIGALITLVIKGQP